MAQRASREWDLADRLHSAAIHVLRRARRTDPLTGVSPAQLSALSVLMSGEMTLGQLAKAEQVRAPTMSRLVREMERAGVARKQPDPKDARAVRIRVTPKGLRALERGREMRIDRIERLVRGRSAEEIAALERAVGVIEDMLGARAAPWSSDSPKERASTDG
ncbi:MAG TPA: MarR family transcriptional regulator [Candidatus Limnocylindria bacterium]